MSKTKLLLILVLLISAMASVSARKKKDRPENLPAQIKIQAIPEDAKVYVDGKLVSTTTPATITIKDNLFVGLLGTLKDPYKYVKGKHDISVKVVKEGYEVIDDIITPKFTSFGKYGSKYVTSWPENVIYELKPSVDKERVSRTRAGKSTLEKTIIRWYFDSAPQGARIFWRVISSVPDEVKNTNELWLGSTPFEETRSFNIEGLTYENSRDVQIEIKVKCKGYVDQNKRFNVRQAIDQQEISSFFDMVKDPNQ